MTRMAGLVDQTGYARNGAGRECIAKQRAGGSMTPAFQRAIAGLNEDVKRRPYGVAKQDDNETGSGAMA